MKCSKWKRASRAAALMLSAVLWLAGLPSEAPAFQFNMNNDAGELVLAIFGNNTEFYYDIGTKASLLAPGALTTIDISGLPGAPFAAGSGVVGGPQTQWEIIGRNNTTTGGGTQLTNSVYVGSQNNSANISIVPNINGLVSKITSWDAFLNISTGATPAGPGAQVFLPSTDPAAYTNITSQLFGLGGTLGGTFNAGGMQGSLGDLLNIIQGLPRNGAGQLNVLSDAGRAVLLASGLLTICGGAGCSVAAVPVPAAAVLFATGLIGLVGIARRKLTGITV